MKKIIILLVPLFFISCIGIPELVKPVTDFSLDRYLGRWYEIARIDNKFERGLTKVTAEYSMREDGGVKVQNRGYKEAKSKWSDIEGKAYFVGDPTFGHLKVSFFGPFYSSYVVFDLDKENYSYAFVSGADESYLWLLSRTPTVSDTLIKRFYRSAQEKGFDTTKILMVDQSK